MYKIRLTNLIFIFLLLFILVNLEVAQLVALLCVGNDAQPVTKIVLLQVLLGQILQVPAEGTSLSEQLSAKMNCGGICGPAVNILLKKSILFRRKLGDVTSNHDDDA